MPWLMPCKVNVKYNTLRKNDETMNTIIWLLYGRTGLNQQTDEHQESLKLL